MTADIIQLNQFRPGTIITEVGRAMQACNARLSGAAISQISQKQARQIQCIIHDVVNVVMTSQDAELSPGNHEHVMDDNYLDIAAAEDPDGENLEHWKGYVKAQFLSHLHDKLADSTSKSANGSMDLRQLMQKAVDATRFGLREYPPVEAQIEEDDYFESLCTGFLDTIAMRMRHDFTVKRADANVSVLT